MPWLFELSDFALNGGEFPCVLLWVAYMHLTDEYENIVFFIFLSAWGFFSFCGEITLCFLESMSSQILFPIAGFSMGIQIRGETLILDDSFYSKETGAASSSLQVPVSCVGFLPEKFGKLEAGRKVWFVSLYVKELQR